MRRHAILLVSLLLCGCSVLPSLPELPTPVRPPELESMADALRAAVQGDYPLDALTFRYAVGSEEWNGRTAVAVYGSGLVEVTFSLQGKRDSWSSSVSEDEFLAICRLLVDRQVWAIGGQAETGIPDEACPTLTVEAEGFEPLRVGMWHAEAQEDPDFKPIADLFAGMAYDISGGTAR